jgi:hypothetical protein
LAIRVLRRIFGLKRDEVTGEWRRLRNKELYTLNPSQDITWLIKSRRLRWMGRVARMGRVEVHRGFQWGTLKGKRPLGRRRCRWENNVSSRSGLEAWTESL